MNLVCLKLHAMFQYSTIRIREKTRCQKGQFAVDIALGLAVVLIISAFIILPGLRELAGSMMTDIKHWWGTTMSTKVFTAS